MLLCVLGGMLAASSGGAERRPADDPRPTPNIVVTQDVAVDSPACRPHRVAVRALRLMDALATLDRRALLGRFWGSDFSSLALFGIPGPDFRSAPESPERTFRRLREWGGLNIRLTELRILVGQRGRTVHATPMGSWLPAEGGPAIPIASGKTEFRCDSPRIPLWNAIAGVPQGPPRCPAPPEPPPEGIETLIVCAVVE